MGSGPLYLGFDLSTQQLKGGLKHVILYYPHLSLSTYTPSERAPGLHV